MKESKWINMYVSEYGKYVYIYIYANTSIKSIYTYKRFKHNIYIYISKYSILKTAKLQTNV